MKDVIKKGKWFFLLLLLLSVFLCIAGVQCVKNRLDPKVADKEIKDENGHLKYILHYSDAGQLINSSYFENDTLRSQISNDAKGRVIEEKLYNDRGTLFTTSKYTYAKTGALTKKEIYDSDKNICYATEYYYTEKGELLKTRYVNSDNDQIIENEIHQDAIIQNVYTDNKKIYGYKNRAATVIFFKYTEDGALSYAYEYNKTNRTTKESIYNENGELHSERVVNQQGMILDEVNYNEGIVSSRVHYEYNRKGGQVKKIEFDKANNIDKRFEYIYDTKGNRVRIDIYDGEGNRIGYY